LASVPVKSSNIGAIDYDPSSKMLTVQFRSGTTWQYADVPPEEHAALMAADSVGSYFARFIRDLYAANPVDDDATGREAAAPGRG
jgi:hypothetical protein